MGGRPNGALLKKTEIKLKSSLGAHRITEQPRRHGSSARYIIRDPMTQGYRPASCGKISTSINIQSYGKHIMSPHDKSKNTNRKHRINHPQITKNRLSRKSSQNVTNDTKTRQDQNINFRVSKKTKYTLTAEPRYMTFEAQTFLLNKDT